MSGLAPVAPEMVIRLKKEEKGKNYFEIRSSLFKRGFSQNFQITSSTQHPKVDLNTEVGL